MKKLKDFFRRYWAMLCIAAILIGTAGYFINIIILDNKTKVLTVLVLSDAVNREELTEELARAVMVGKREEILVQTVDADSEKNQGAVVTWMRSGTIDIIVGDEDQMGRYGRYGYLKDLGEMGLSLKGEKLFSRIAEFDNDGEILSEGDAYWSGLYMDAIPGVGIASPVISIAANAAHVESGAKVLELLGQ